MLLWQAHGLFLQQDKDGHSGWVDGTTAHWRSMLWHVFLPLHFYFKFIGHSSCGEEQEVSFSLLLSSGQLSSCRLFCWDCLRLPDVQHRPGVQDVDSQPLVFASGSPGHQPDSVPGEPPRHRRGAPHVHHEDEDPQQPHQEESHLLDHINLGHRYFHGRCSDPGLELPLWHYCLLIPGTHLQQKLPGVLECLEPGCLLHYGGGLHKNLHVRPEENQCLVLTH